MNACAKCGVATISTQIVPIYDADILGAPFKVYLRDAVRVELCDGCGAVRNTAIPDPEGLLYTISLCRALHSRKLTGAEIKFMRNVMGWKATKLAEELAITPEHLSRVENGHVPLSITTEKLFRFYAILHPGVTSTHEPVTKEKALEIFKDAASDVMEMIKAFKIESSWSIDKPLEFHFERRSARTGAESDDGRWKPEKHAA